MVRHQFHLISMLIYSSLSSSISSSSSSLISLQRICLKKWLIISTNLIIIPEVIKSQIIGIGDVIDESGCYQDLYNADENKDNWVDRSEFVAFANLQSDGYFQYTGGDFDSLPEELKRVYNDHAICPNGILSNLCFERSKRIDVSGAAPNAKPTSSQSVALFSLCSSTFSVIENVRTPAPTPTPSFSPTFSPTSSPTLTPSYQPSAYPSTSSPTVIILKPPPEQPEPEIQTTTLSPGTIASITITACIIGFLVLGFLYKKEKQRKKRPIETAQLEPPPPKTPPPDAQQAQAPSTPTTLGATSPHYEGGAGALKVAPITAAPPLSDEEISSYSKHSLDDVESQASSSNAGSSGWSSSAGVSSMNTASVDSLERDMLLGGNLATIGYQSSIATRLATNTSSLQYVPEATESETIDLESLTAASDQIVTTPSSTTRADLDQAIEAGDWAAVGRTATLLASNSGSISSPKSDSISRSSKDSYSNLSSADAVRAAELDRLVDMGDWEGVVLAATKFEASSENDANKSTDSDIKQTKSDTKSAADVSAYSNSASSFNSPQSAGSGISTSASAAQKQEEIRAEVETLVRRVVPDEIDNVDEMMLQFKGREDELIETLRTMQERSIAQRARAAMHKNAKREARRSRLEKSSTSGFPPRPPIPTTASTTASNSQLKPQGRPQSSTAILGVASAVSATSQTSNDSISNKSEEYPNPSSQASAASSKRDRTRSALEQAIENGDWEAVGEAAALMSDASVTTASTMELQQLVDAEYDTSTANEYETCSSKGGVTQDSFKSINIQRAAELDRLIDQGDWSGVVAAASRFSSMDAMAKRESQKEQPVWKITSSGASISSTEENEDYESKPPLTSKEKALQEEKDALAQAEIWMAIAAQSKQEASSEAKGASDAADWAISRSLNALNNAAQQQQPKSSYEKTLDNESISSNTKSILSEDDKSV